MPDQNNTDQTNAGADQSQSGAGDTSNTGGTQTDTQNKDGGAQGGGNTSGTDGTSGAGDTSKSGETKTGDTVVKTDADGKPLVEEKKEVAGVWPPDWRIQMAGDDKTFLGQLERFASPLDMAKKIREQERLISSGTLKQPLPKDATPEQLATFRKENGIPETSDKYDLTLPDGLIIGEEDKPILNNVLNTMHKHNLSPEAVKDIVADYKKQEMMFLADRTRNIDTMKQQNDDMLHKEWGDQYRSEVNRVENLLNTYSKETQEAIQFGTDADGLPFLNNVHVMRDLAVQSRLINPVSTVVSGGGTNQAASVDTEIAGLESKMGDRESDYWKGSTAEKQQARYRELVDWRENNKKKNTA